MVIGNKNTLHLTYCEITVFRIVSDRRIFVLDRPNSFSSSSIRRSSVKSSDYTLTTKMCLSISVNVLKRDLL